MPALLHNIATYFPETVLTNEDLALKFDVSIEQIYKSVGIKRRHVAASGELASDMGIRAAEKLFETYSEEKQKVDLLLFCSVCFDYSAPATSCIMQDTLGLSKTTACIDLPYGCSGYVYGLAMAKSFITSGMATTVLFITSDTLTKTIDPKNLELRSIFSDVATATLITKDNYKNIGNFVFGTDGGGGLDVHISKSAFRQPVDRELVEAGLPNGKFVMEGMKVFNFGLRVVPQLVNDTLEKNGLVMDDVDLFIFHQPSRFLLDVLRKKINIPEQKFFINIEEHGNTSSTSIPLALKDALDQGKLKTGMTVLVAGFGVGYSWAATVIKI